MHQQYMLNTLPNGIQIVISDSNIKLCIGIQVKGKEPNCLDLEALQASLTLASDRMSLFREDKCVADGLCREKKEKKAKKVF